MQTEEPAYKYFMAAFKYFLSKLSAKPLAMDAGVSESYLSQIKIGKKIAGFQGQIKIARGCGYDYLDFLQLGRELIEGPAENSVPEKEKVETPDPVVSMHQDLIKGFKERDIAKHVTQNLIKIEALDPKKYYMLAGKIENMAEELENAAGENKDDKDNDQGKHQTA